MSGKKSISIKSARELLEFESSSSASLSSGCKLLDNLMGGGFLPGTTTEISGEAGCGKSQICMQLTAVTIARGLKAICVETERGFSVKRVHQMLRYHTNNVEDAMQRLLISSPNTVEQLLHLLTELEHSASQLKETSVLIVDSIATVFRGYLGKGDFQKWDRVLTILTNIAVHHNVAVIYVNHVASRHDDSLGEWTTVPFLSRICSRSPTVRLWLERRCDGLETSRRISLMKSPFAQRRSSEFIITSSGLSLDVGESRCG